MQFIEADDWRNVKPEDWRWPNFHPLELACKGTGRLKVAVRLMDGLQALRTGLGRPMVVLSGFRSLEHNRAVGGATGSKHMLGTAADISMVNHDPILFHSHAKLVGFLGFGFYPAGRGNFMHIDLGPSRFWGDPEPWGIKPN